MGIRLYRSTQTACRVRNCIQRIWNSAKRMAIVLYHNVPMKSLVDVAALICFRFESRYYQVLRCCYFEAEFVLADNDSYLYKMSLAH